jgi:hypothetical protein
MVAFRPEKVLGAPPSPLTPNAVYFVRVGTGIMIYVADATGSVAYPINQGGNIGSSGEIDLATYEYLVALGLGG